MLKIITPLAWLFMIATLVLGATSLIGDADLIAYLLPCLALAVALSVVRLTLIRRRDAESTAG